MKALEENYTAEIDYPVRYRNFPDDKTLIGEVPDHLKLTVYAHGYVLLQHKISARYIPLIISVRSFSLKKFPENESGFYFLETRYIKDYIDKQLSSEFEILEVNPDTLVFPFASVKSKILPVVSHVGYQLDRQLILKDMVQVTPDSVRITGPDYLIDTLKTMHTREVNLGVISRSRTYTVGLNSFPHTTLYPEDVEVSFHLERFTEKSISVPVVIENAPEGLKLITFPAQVELTCQVGLSNYEKLQAGMFKFAVDYNEISQGKEQLSVRLKRFPEFVKAIRFAPGSVEYLIER